jgi:monoamine oxidase
MSGRAIVVGGGISGLAAAWRLERLGHQVTVLESRHEAGGRVRSEAIGDYLVDTGPDAATAGYKHWLQLVDDLGLSNQVAPTSAVLGVVRDGRIIDINPRKPLRAAMTPAISWPGKARMAIGLARLRSRLKVVDSYQLNLSADLDDPGVNAYQFARRYFGEEVAEYVIDGAMRLVTGSGSRETSQLGVLGALTGWSVPTVNIRGGLQRVPRAIAKRLTDVRLGSQALVVAQTGAGVEVTYRDDTGTSRQVDGDACVIATMFHTAREIWPEIDHLAPDSVLACAM